MNLDEVISKVATHSAEIDELKKMKAELEGAIKDMKAEQE